MLNFPNVDLYAVTRYVAVEEEKLPDKFFQNDDTVVEVETVQSPHGETEDESDCEENDTHD